jgi:hypothetical protein
LTVPDIWSLIDKGGIVAFLLLLMFGGHRRLWVFGWMYEASQKEVEYWRNIALQALDLGLTAVGEKPDDRDRDRYLDDQHRVQRRGR